MNQAFLESCVRKTTNIHNLYIPFSNANGPGKERWSKLFYPTLVICSNIIQYSCLIWMCCAWYQPKYIGRETCGFYFVKCS